MQTLTIELGSRSYPILIGPGLVAERGLIARHVGAGAALVVTNATVAPLWLERLQPALDGLRTETCVLPDGEEHKTLTTLSTVLDALVAGRYNRDCVVIALGGGVIGDLAGFAAACYQRGVACVQVPTTLLAQVDSSVGGKTGVNHPGGKNLIGAFHQPSLVIADTDTLATLPAREFGAGLAEVIKYGLIADRAFYDWLEQNLQQLLDRDAAALAHAIHRSCANKARLVALDEREQGPRALLNLGHTFGHAIETGAGYGTWLHGEAVAAGTVLAAEMSARLGWLTAEDVARVRALFTRAGLPVAAPPLSSDRLLELMRMDKKVKAGQLRLVLLKSIGEAVLTADYPADALRATLDAHPRAAA